MKKAFFGVLCLIAFAPVIKADILRSSKEEPVALKYHINGLTTSTSTVLIDLSDTTNFPHKYTGAINIANISVQVDKLDTSSGTIKIGVVTRVDVSSADVKYFYEASYNNTVAASFLNEVTRFTNTAGFFFRTKVNSANNTPYIISNDTSNTAIFQTDVQLPSPNGNILPGKGDIVLSFTNNGSGATRFVIDLLYNSENP